MKRLKFAILLILFSGLFRDKKNILMKACNNFNDYCDAFNEELDDINSKLDLQLNPLSTSSSVNKNNYSNLIDDERYHIDEMKRKRPNITGQDEKEMSRQVTTILDKLLVGSGYDKQIRPHINGPPVEVKLNRNTQK